ncbi:MAG: DNA-3-methyladenine glycosylase 2 family protein [Chloroflexota bacterium]
MSGTDPLATMTALWMGPGDPQMRVEMGEVARAFRLRSGVASLLVTAETADGTQLLARAWGAGASEALDLVPGLVGELDDLAPLRALLAADEAHAVVKEIARRLPGARLTRGAAVYDMLLNAIIGQKVTSTEARSAQRQLLWRFGEAAPGPLGLRLPPPPEKLARLPYWALHPLGLERRRADTLRAAAAVAPRLEEIRQLEPDEGRRRLLAVPGVGPWTAAETMRLALGDPDAVSVGDFHLPRLVSWNLTGVRDADDARMLELLEPYRGQRARVVYLIECGGAMPERRAPRFAARSIAAI